MLWWEWHLGDAAYEACVGIPTRYVQPAMGALFPHQIYFNTYINFYRQYIEHTMHIIKNHNMWRAIACHNDLPLLQAAMDITVHMTNVAIKRPWQKEFNRRYPGFHHDTPHYP
jgi:hypothetical protein